MRKSAWFRGPLLAMAMVLMGGSPAYADIASFNAAMIAKDYKTAAAEAATTWPTLDKSRDDLPVIAREFGFATYLAGDYAGARMFAEAAASAGAALGEADALRAASVVLRELAAHKLAPSAATRDKLYHALETRAALPGLDLVSYFAVDVATAYDFERGAWREAEASAALGERLAGAGGDMYAIYALRFDLFENVAEYMRTRDVKVYRQLSTLKDQVLAAVNAAASDEDAEPFARFYWEVSAWGTSVGTHLVGRRKMKWPDPPEKLTHNPEDRAVRMMNFRTEEDVCRSELKMRREVKYPSSALYKGQIGTVILRIDVNAAGEATNPEILTAVPERLFGKAVLDRVKDMRYHPTDKWGEQCSLSQPGRVTTFIFAVG